MIIPIYSLPANHVLFGVEPPLPPPPRGERASSLPAEWGPDVSVDLSPLAVILSEEGLDFNASAVGTVAVDLDFNLEFTSSSVERLSVSGYFSEESATMQLSVHFTYQREVVVDGRAELRTFEADLQVNVSQVNRRMISSYQHKEDIMSLVRRLLEDIHELADDESRILGGVMLDFSDFQELFAVDDGQLVRQLMALIELTITLARLKQMLDGPQEAVVLAPKREVTEGLFIVQENIRVEHFQLRIRDVTAQISQVPAPPEAPGLSPSGVPMSSGVDGTPPEEAPPTF